MPRRGRIADSDEDDEPVAQPQRSITIDSDEDDEPNAPTKRFRIPRKVASGSSEGMCHSDAAGGTRASAFPGGGLRHLAGGAVDTAGYEDVEQPSAESEEGEVSDEEVACGNTADSPIDVGASDMDVAGGGSDGSEEDDCCWTCGRPGRLICCDGPGCEAQHHLSCVGLHAVPKGDWFCPTCASEGVGKKRKGKSKALVPKEVTKKEKARSKKVMRDEDLAESTRAAMAAEAARREAINLVSPVRKKVRGGDDGGKGEAASSRITVDTSGDNDDERGVTVETDSHESESASLQPLILNPSEAAATPGSAVCIQSSIASQMKAHQKEAVRFLFENLVVSLEALCGGNPYANPTARHRVFSRPCLTLTRIFSRPCLCTP